MRVAVSPLVLLVLLLVLAGCGTPSLLITPVSNTSRLQEVDVSPAGTRRGGAKIAVIEIEGILINARRGGFLQPTENKLSLFTQQLDRARADGRVKAVVLRINSPGGTVTCSDTMYEMIRRFRAQTGKPVVASTQEVCASGAYYVACGADAIVAQPTSVVGSIGVIFNTFDFSGTMAKLGIRSEAITSGELKDMASPLKPLDPAARAVMQGMINEYHGRFVGVVTGNRRQLNSDPQRVKLATDGRVFSGQQALAMGLVDQLGSLEDAIALARQLSGARDARIVMYKRPYGYSGSIYADQSTPVPRAGVLTIELPEIEAFLPRGFYYLWTP
ncbi:signal peptide peptidase SppA [Fontivita pretiosa]|uniref:signal peptide peptidase SppA n=1 Tax=Fontivita pretiosa TaxID=2989684 RepID=UPI003D17994C